MENDGDTTLRFANFDNAPLGDNANAHAGGALERPVGLAGKSTSALTARKTLGGRPTLTAGAPMTA
jgi:hypothetical protein